MIEAISRGDILPPQDCNVNQKIFSELSVVDGLILRGDKIVPPDAPEHTGGVNVRTKLLDIAHEGHPGENSMKRYVRSRLWFPKMDQEISEITRGCLACQASTVTKTRDPLIPSSPPDELWQNLAADHWGPTPDGHFLLVVIDELSRYPEVEVVKSTGAEENIEAFDNIFARHGFCKQLKTDNGPPFNGKDSHLLQRYFKWAGIHHQPTRSAEDPEANGLAEGFMKICRKAWHTAIVEGNNPRAELNKTLQLYRGTPHPTTGYAPAELLFGRKFRTRLPQLPVPDAREDLQKAREKEEVEKKKQKAAKDSKSYVKPHSIEMNDEVLLKQRSTKSKPPYDPHPYVVTDINGHQITAERDGKEITRDAQKWKNFKGRLKPNYSSDSMLLDRREEDDSFLLADGEEDVNTQINRNIPHDDIEPDVSTANDFTAPRRSTRERRRPKWFRDYETGT